MMFDKEIEAIAKCTDLIKDLDDTGRIRVIKYLIERFGIGQLPRKNDIKIAHEIPRSFSENQDFVQEVTFEHSDEFEYPTLKQLLIKNYPKNETEWLLCYAFFASKCGTDTFKKEDIVEKYRENNRLTKSASANLSNNINSCIKKDWIKDINKDEFFLKDEGIQYAKEILKGKSTAKEIRRVKKSKPTLE